MDPNFLTYMSTVASTAVTGLRGVSDAPTRRGALSLLLTLCRNMEDVAPRNVSVRAAARGRELGIPDLRVHHWDAGSRFPGGRAASRLHWEHWRPAVDVRDDLLALADPSPEACARVLATSRVAWILLDENRALDALGARTRRRDPERSYADAGIELAYPWV